MEQLKLLNPDSTIEHEKNDDETLSRIFISFKFMETILSNVKEVVSLDACHIKHRSGGIIYTAMVETSTRAILPIGFGISEGNENYNNWLWFMIHLSYACPSLVSKKFVFISDRDKGLAKSLRTCYPYNMATKCTFHIRQNVQQKFGAVFGGMIDKLGKTFNVNEWEDMLEKLKHTGVKKTKKFVEYLETMPRFSWRSLDWVLNDQLFMSLPDDDDSSNDDDEGERQSPTTNQGQSPASNQSQSPFSNEGGSPASNNIRVSVAETQEAHNLEDQRDPTQSPAQDVSNPQPVVMNASTATVEHESSPSSAREDAASRANEPIREVTNFLQASPSAPCQEVELSREGNRDAAMVETSQDGTREDGTGDAFYEEFGGAGRIDVDDPYESRADEAETEVHDRTEEDEEEDDERRQAAPMRAVSYCEYIDADNKDDLIVHDLQPRYGITTSNMSESFNSSMGKYRDKSWFDIIDDFVSQVIEQNATEYKKWKDSNPSAVVENVREELKKRWDLIPKYEICCLRSDGSRYVVYSKNDQSYEGTRHTLYLDLQYCTCGKLQEHRLPCMHTMVYLKQCNVVDSFEDLLDSQYIPLLYRQGSIIKCFENNIIPPASTLIESDGKTLEPKRVRPAGRPAKKRLRKSRAAVQPDKVPKLCSKCKQPGHNIKTCTNAPYVD